MDDGVSASYNGLLLSANHRLSRNFSVLANDTWSHCINNGDVQSEITQRFLVLADIRER